MSFQLLALIILGVFYVLYIIKWLGQRHAKAKSGSISVDTLRDMPSALELITHAAVILVTAAQVASIFLGEYLGKPMPLPDWCVFIIRCVGAAFGVIAVLVFWLAIRAMKSNWRVGIDRSGSTKLVTKGIYSYSRNPAYLAFDLLFIGMLLMYYNKVLLICSIFAAIMLHVQIMMEERYLKKAFGQQYIDYMTRVRRYFGRIND